MAIQNAGERIPLIPLSEAARRLSVCYMTAWRWSKAGRFNGLTKEKGRVFVPVASVEALLAEREVRHA